MSAQNDAGRPGPRIALAAALFVASAGGLVIEITAGRLLAPYVGMTLYSWTAVIAVVLAGLSAGHWAGGYIAERPIGRQRAGLSFAFFGAAVSSLASLAILNVLAKPLLESGGHAFVTLGVLTGAAFFLPAFFSGVPGPVLTRLAIAGAPERAGRILGQMFAVGALGAIAGTLASGFLFIAWIGSRNTMIAVAALFLLCGLLFRFPLGRISRLDRVALSGLVAAAAAVTAWGVSSSAFVSACDRESPYHCVRIIDARAETGAPSRLMVLDHLGHGINLRDEKAALWGSYAALSDHLVAARFARDRPVRAFFIGGGAYTLPRHWLARYPAAELVVAEIDPAVTAVALSDFWLTADARLTVRHSDARVALAAERDAPFDVVVGDAFRDITIPPHLVSREFAQEISESLTPSGLYLLHVIDGAGHSPLLFSLVATLSQVFPVVEVWGDAEQLRQGGRITYLVAAGSEATATSRIQAADGSDRLWVRWPGDDLMARVRASDALILTDDHAPVTRLMAQHLAATFNEP
ncbi:MAG: fused MFS/spermidine synthase [Kiloniellales bacterium]|nr:fused MFS/spermidine synthase [Kiloniellales bacterium]